MTEELEATAGPAGESKDFKKLRECLEQFKTQKANEFKFRPIEKFMLKELGVERMPNKGGSHISFRHGVLEKEVGIEGGLFRVALKHGSKKPILYRTVFLEYLYPELNRIIDLLEKVEKGEE